MQESVVNDIRAIRNTKTFDSFELKKKNVVAKWKRKISLRIFFKYFSKQWLDSPFCNWQLFQTPAGFSMSNCPIESYNNKIKAFFTDRKKFNLLPVFEIFEKVVKIESRDSLKIEIPKCPKLKVSVIKEAKNLVEKNTIEKLRIENGVSMFLCNGKHSVELDPDCVCPECTKCSCCIFLDSAVCTHLVGCCIVDSFEYPGLRTEKFISKTKSKKRKAGAWHEKD